MFTLSVWYKHSELAKRMAFFYIGSQLSGAFAGLIAAGVVNGMDGYVFEKTITNLRVLDSNFVEQCGRSVAVEMAIHS